MEIDLTNSNNKLPVLICYNKQNGLPRHVDVYHCHRRFFGKYGEYVPNYSCGDKNNIHVCKELTKHELDLMMKISHDYAEVTNKQK